MKCCNSTGRACWGVTALFVALIFLLLAIFMPSFIDSKIEDGVRDMVLQTPKARNENGDGWKQFEDNSRPDSNALYQKFYFWNITNPHDVLYKGAKAKVVEVGPYVYRANQRRLNITFWTDRNGFKQVKYKIFKWYTFERSLTDLKLDPKIDYITTANMMFQATMLLDKRLAFLIYNDSSRFSDFSRLFFTRQVEWLIFGGKSFDSPFSSFPGLIANSTKEGLATEGFASQYTGEDHLFLSNQLTMWKGFTNIQYDTLPPPNVDGPFQSPWKTYEANELRGTLGEAFAPLNSFKKGDSIPVYVDDAYTSMALINVGNEVKSIKGVDLLVFRLTEKMLQNSTNNPENEPYWMNGPNGFWNLSGPRLAPLFVSMPHFLYCDQSVKDLVEGLNPNEQQHSTWLGVEPWTGMTLGAQKTFQVNIPLKTMNVSDGAGAFYTWFPNVTKGLYMPVAWINYGGEMTDTIASEIKGQVYVGVTAKSVMKWGGFSFGCVLLPVGLALLLSAMKQLRSEQRDNTRVISSRSGYKRISAG